MPGQANLGFRATNARILKTWVARRNRAPLDTSMVCLHAWTV